MIINISIRAILIAGAVVAINGVTAVAQADTSVISAPVISSDPVISEAIRDLQIALSDSDTNEIYRRSAIVMNEARFLKGTDHGDWARLSTQIGRLIHFAATKLSDGSWREKRLAEFCRELDPASLSKTR